MVKLTQACRYATKAMALLAAGGNGRQLTAEQLAGNGRTPRKFLAKVLVALARARLLQAKNGPGGGYRLARPARQITLLQIVEAVEGPIRGDLAAIATRNGDGVDKRLLSVCALAAANLRKSLEKTRLSDLANSIS